MTTLKQPRILIVLGLALLLAVIWLGAWYAIDHNRSELLVSAESSARYQAHIYAENTLSTIKRLDTMLRDLRAHWDGNPAKFAAAVRERVAYMDDVAFQVAVIDAQGYLAFSNLAAPDKPVSLGERTHFRVHQDNPAIDRLFISAPVKGKVSGKWSLQFTRPILQQGRFDGVLVISVSPDTFATFNEKLDLRDGAVSAMVADSGNWLARQPNNEQAMGRKVDGAPYILPGAPLSGSFTRVAQADGIERIYGFRRLPDYELNFVVGHAMAKVLAPNRSYRDSVLAAAAVVSLLAVILIWLLGRSVAARSAAQSELRNSEARYRALIDHMPMGITVMDRNFNIVLSNRTIEQMFMSEPGAFTGHKCFRSLAKRTEPCDHCPGMLAMKNGGAHDVFTQGVRDDGSIVHMHNRTFPHFNAQGEIDGFVELVEDITHRKRMEHDLANSEARLRTIVATEPECVKIVDRQGRLMEMNPAGLALVEADTAQQVVGRPVVDLIAPEYREAYQRMHAQVVAGVPQAMEYELNGLKGGRTWAETHAVPMQLDGETVHLAITRDISERKRNEAALQQAKEAAEAANVAKSRFLATMSHEIRTPMNGILGMAQMLLMPNLSEQERQEYARIVLTSGQSLLTLLNDILDLSKIEADRIELKASAFEPEQLLAENAALFVEQAQARGLRFDFAWHGPTDRRYRADAQRLRQMIANLLSNAIKFTGQGAIVLAGAEIESTAGQALLEFSVTDTGCGIPPDKLPRLFKVFSQVDDSPTRAHGGTGLGLSIVARLARLMGGDVGVDSTPGQGSRFWFRIRADVLPVGSETRQQERHRAGDAPRNLRVLLVEDNPANRRVVEAMLTKNGIGVDSVENGEQAVAAIANGPRPDLVLMDCQMPVMDGHNATQQIRAIERGKGWPRLPIIALTAGAFAEEKQACLASGMDDFLAKPVDSRDLLTMIDQWTNRKPP